MNTLDGVLVVNKPAGMTSHDVISALRKKYHQKKFGHTGTLDPQASGVLVVLAGKAAKLLPFLQDTDKEYIASMSLGMETDTDDIWGTITNRAPVRTDFDFEEIVKSLKGKRMQRIPAVSAKKVNGKKLYEYQRQGLEVPVLENEIEIYDTKVLDPDKLQFQVSCSSGTYVRSLCKEIARQSGNLGVMDSLVRTKASGFRLDQAQDLEDDFVIYPMLSLINYPLIELKNPKKAANGVPLKLNHEEPLVAITHEGELVAIYERGKDGMYYSKRGFSG